MSIYAEYLHAETEEARLEAWQDCLYEARKEDCYDHIDEWEDEAEQ